jgi:hypothetical protein
VNSVKEVFIVMDNSSVMAVNLEEENLKLKNNESILICNIMDIVMPAGLKPECSLVIFIQFLLTLSYVTLIVNYFFR